MLRLLHEVVRLNRMLATQPAAVPAGAMLNQVLEASLRRADHDHLVVLISDLDGADEATLRAVAQDGGGSYFFAADRLQLAGTNRTGTAESDCRR